MAICGSSCLRGRHICPAAVWDRAGRVAPCNCRDPLLVAGLEASAGASFCLKRSTSPSVVKCSLIRRNDRLANRPKCDAGELEMRPGKWDSDDGHGKKNRHDDMAERQPPPREHQPYDVSQNSKGP